MNQLENQDEKEIVGLIKKYKPTIMVGPTTPGFIVQKFQAFGCIVYKQWMSQEERESLSNNREEKISVDVIKTNSNLDDMIQSVQQDYQEKLSRNNKKGRK